jgi:hypothetical protein
LLLPLAASKISDTVLLPLWSGTLFETTVFQLVQQRCGETTAGRNSRSVHVQEAHRESCRHRESIFAIRIVDWLTG